jgi:lipopolysaccharide/colanic/teichoic acid biosynthesis glycosyltransferase
MVGPRPERPEIAALYRKEFPEFDYRLKMKAGLTGYAQVYGKYNTTPRDKVKLDMTYYEKYSIWLDFKLILLTFKILFQKENTEGINANQTTAIRVEKGKTAMPVKPEGYDESEDSFY